jgi:hypothetical protein
LIVEALYVPAAQFEQLRSLFTFGATFSYFPAPQLVTAVQDVALLAVEKLVPRTHDTQVRSYVMEGGGLENWPGLQVTFQGEQEVDAGAVLN